MSPKCLIAESRPEQDAVRRENLTTSWLDSACICCTVIAAEVTPQAPRQQAMDFARPIMWNVPLWAEITLYAMIPLVMIAFLAGAVWRVRKWFLGQAEPGTPTTRQQLVQALHPPRLAELVKTALFQSRLARDGFSLVMHQAIFWGMVFLAIGTALATVDQDFTNLLLDWQLLSGRFYLLFEFVLDVFGVVLIVGVAMAAYRRYVLRPERLQAKRTRISLWDAFPFLTFLVLISVTGLSRRRLADRGGSSDRNPGRRRPGGRGREAGGAGAVGFARTIPHGPERQDAELQRIAEGGAVFPAAIAAPVGHGLAKALAPLPLDSIRLLHQLLWWAHALLAFGLIVSIPFTKAFHLISSPANMLFRHPAPAGRLPVVAESGVRTVRDYTWRQLLQVDACTWCGKCQEVCPGLQHRLSAVAPRFCAGRRLAVAAHQGEGQRRYAQPARLDHPGGGTLGVLRVPRVRRHLSGARPASAADHRHAPPSGRPGASRRGACKTR